MVQVTMCHQHQQVALTLIRTTQQLDGLNPEEVAMERRGSHALTHTLTNTPTNTHLIIHAHLVTEIRTIHMYLL